MDNEKIARELVAVAKILISNRSTEVNEFFSRMFEYGHDRTIDQDVRKIAKGYRRKLTPEFFLVLGNRDFDDFIRSHLDSALQNLWDTDFSQDRKNVELYEAYKAGQKIDDSVSDDEYDRLTKAAEKAKDIAGKMAQATVLGSFEELIEQRISEAERKMR